MSQKSYVIGLIGETGAGKSLVASMLAHLGGRVIDADALAHLALLHGQAGYTAVWNRYGQKIAGEDGAIDRSRLARIVFDDVRELSWLESVIHPLVSCAFSNLLARVENGVVVFEAVKLVESGLHQRCDAIWLVKADAEIRAARLVGRGMSRTDAQKRVSQQTPSAYLSAYAQVEIDNSFTVMDTWSQVDNAWKAMRAPSGKKSDAFDMAEAFSKNAFSGFRLMRIDQESDDLVELFTQILRSVSDENSIPDIRLMLAEKLVYFSDTGWLIGQLNGFTAKFAYIERQLAESAEMNAFVTFLSEATIQAQQRFCHGIQIASRVDDDRSTLTLRENLYNMESIPPNWLPGLTLRGYNIATKQIDEISSLFIYL